jgi:hypothetical protein
MDTNTAVARSRLAAFRDQLKLLPETYKILRLGYTTGVPEYSVPEVDEPTVSPNDISVLLWPKQEYQQAQSDWKALTAFVGTDSSSNTLSSQGSVSVANALSSLNSLLNAVDNKALGGVKFSGGSSWVWLLGIGVVGFFLFSGKGRKKGRK